MSILHFNLTACYIVSVASSKTGIAGAIQLHVLLCFSFAAKFSATKGMRKASPTKRTAFPGSSKGKISKEPCLSHNENHRLKMFYASLHVK